MSKMEHLYYNSKAKYLICPGCVTSVNDGESHYIGYASLIRLYKLNINECERETTHTPPGRYRDLIVLNPRSKGDYIEHLNSVIGLTNK